MTRSTRRRGAWQRWSSGFVILQIFLMDRFSKPAGAVTLTIALPTITRHTGPVGKPAHPQSRSCEEAAVKIAVIGTGYVGLVTGTCLAESGNDVVGVDKDASKIEMLHGERLPIYEPGLLELVQRNRAKAGCTFTTDLAAAVARAD